MADYYIDAQGGDDGNDGLTPSTPIATLNEGFGLRLLGYTDDDTIHLSGTFRGDLALGTDAIVKVLTPGQRVTVKQWAGMPQAVIRGDVVLPNADLTYGGSAGIFTYTFAAGYFDTKDGNCLPEAIASVVANWDTVVDADGYHHGHLVRAQSAADCATRVNSWWFERTGAEGTPGTQTGGGVLTINVGTTAGGIDAALTSTGALTSAGLTIAYCRGNRNGIEIGNPTYQDNVFTLADFATINPDGTRYLTVDGIHVYLFCDSGWRTRLNGLGAGYDVGPSGTVGTRSIGYGIRIADGLNCVVKNCTVIDSGYHGIMFVGDLCRFNTMLDCAIYGSGNNPTSGNSIGGAFYTGNSGPGNKNIEGCVARNVTLYKYTQLGRTLESAGGTYAIPIQYPFDATGSAAYTTCTTDGFISHTNAAANNRVLDVEYRNCHIIERGKKSDNSMGIGNPYIGGDSGPTSLPSDPMNAATYPVRFYDCTLTNGCKNRTSGGQSVAYVRCAFDFARAGSQVGDTSGIVPSLSGTHYALFDACALTFNLDHASGDRAIFQCSLNNRVYMKNVSVYVNGTLTNKQRIFNFLSGALGSRVQARGCIIGFRANKSNWDLLTMGVGPSGTELNETVFDMNDCFYFNITVPCGFPGPNTMSEWINGGGDWASGAGGAAIDQQAVDNGTTNPFADGATTAAANMNLTAAAKLVRKVLGIHTDFGVNGPSYSGNYGAWQYGGGGTFRDRGGGGASRSRPIMAVR